MLESWQKIARRIRVPLGFLTAVVYLFELWRRAPRPSAIALSSTLVLPGLWLRAYAAGYVKKNRELTQTGPYAYTRNPLYLGSILMATGFASAMLSWAVALLLAAIFLIVYVPVIAGEERFLRSAFPEFEMYCRRVPRLLPRFPRARPTPGETEVSPGKFSFELYLKHREYNAAVGVILLYLSLLFLRPALNFLVRMLH